MSTSFVDEARTESEWRPRTPCGVRTFLETLPAADLGGVREALVDGSITSAAICRVFERRYGSSPKQAVLARHRRGDCNCE